MAKKIFLSYSRRDLSFVEKLAHDLIDVGYEVWYDLSTIEGGDRWAQEIQAGINRSEVFVIVVTPNSVASEWVEKEYLYASRRGMKIVPLLRESCELPIWLLNIQYVDIVGANYVRNFHQIVDAFSRYGRRQGDVKQLPVSWKKRIGKIIRPSAIIIILITTSLVLLFLPDSPISLYPLKGTQAVLYPSNSPVPTRTVDERPTQVQQFFTETLSPRTPSTPAKITPTLIEETTTPTVGIITSTPTHISITKTVTPSNEMIDAFGVKMLYIPAGGFLMGSIDGHNDAQPVHVVMLESFYIDQFEVTNAQYQACVLDSGYCDLPLDLRIYLNPEYSNHPVVFVTWDMANDFCEWRDGRLPTEAEWERTSRGEQTQSYPWGNNMSDDIANFCDSNCQNVWMSNLYDDYYVKTAPVGSYEEGKSSYGAYDMAGNVWEWVSDWYKDDYYQNSPANNPLGPKDGLYRVLRGGSWFDPLNYLYSYRRSQALPATSSGYIGFRCAKNTHP